MHPPSSGVGSRHYRPPFLKMMHRVLSVRVSNFGLGKGEACLLASWTWTLVGICGCAFGRVTVVVGWGVHVHQARLRKTPALKVLYVSSKKLWSQVFGKEGPVHSRGRTWNSLQGPSGWKSVRASLASPHQSCRASLDPWDSLSSPLASLPSSYP